MWCINLSNFATAVLWVLSVTSFIMMVTLVVVFTQRDKDIHRIDKQIFGPFEWWQRRKDAASRIDTLYNFHRILEKDVLDLKNKFKHKKKEVKN